MDSKAFLLCPLQAPVSSPEGLTRLWVFTVAAFPKQAVPLEELHKEGNVSRCDCRHVVAVDDPEIPCGNSACGLQMEVLAASVSPPANVKQLLSYQSCCPRVDLQLVGHSRIQKRSWWLHRQERRAPPDS